MDYMQLKTELADTSYVALVPQEGLALDDAIAQDINGRTAAVTLPLPIASLQAFLDSREVPEGLPAAGVALSLAIEDLAAAAPSDQVPAALVYAARMLRRIDVAKYPTIEVANAGKMRQLGEAMVAAGIMSTDQVTAMVALFPAATVPFYQTLGFDGPITGRDVSAAREA